MINIRTIMIIMMTKIIMLAIIMVIAVNKMMMITIETNKKDQ